MPGYELNKALSGDTKRLYADLVNVGGLGNALRAALREIGSPLSVAELNKAIGFITYAYVKAGGRSSQVYIAAHERLFLFDFWCRGVMLAKGQTPNLRDAAQAINYWVGSEGNTAALAARFPFVMIEPTAGVYERGAEVEHRWQEYLADMGEYHRGLTDFVRAASMRQELRQLFPFTSLDVFCFSRCTGVPFTRDIPCVRALGNDQYQVLELMGRVLGQGDANAAVDLVVQLLPPGCGPAVPGTAEDLANG